MNFLHERIEIWIFEEISIITEEVECLFDSLMIITDHSQKEDINITMSLQLHKELPFSLKRAEIVTQTINT